MLDRQLRASFEQLGRALAGFHLRGLFGIDCVIRDNTLYPVEINPRYTASMEVLEHALGVPLLDLHRRVFDIGPPPRLVGRLVPGIIGKAILFARRPLIFPPRGPWRSALRKDATPWELPAFADVPHPQTPIAAGRPVLTFFARARSETACLVLLKQAAAELDLTLFG